jgi:hypothetical protein
MMLDNGRVAPYAPTGQRWVRRLWVGLRSTWVPLTAIVLFNADSFIFASIGGGAEYSGTLAPFMLGYLLVPIGFVGIWWPRVAGALALVAYGCAVVSEALWAEWERPASEAWVRHHRCGRCPGGVAQHLRRDMIHRRVARWTSAMSSYPTPSENDFANEKCVAESGTPSKRPTRAEVRMP